jgi:aspartyl-tRNA synthetase
LEFSYWYLFRDSYLEFRISKKQYVKYFIYISTKSKLSYEIRGSIMTDNEKNIAHWQRDKFAAEISQDHFNSELTVAGWIHEIRNLGGIAFILLRDRSGILQVTAIKKEMGNDQFKEITTLPKESVLAVRGVVQPNDKVKAGFEVLAKEFSVLGLAKSPLPLGVADEDKAELDTKLDTRLDSRFLDLRKPDVAAIFKIRSSVLSAIRQHFEDEGFIEVQTPKIVATATEGGTELFPVQYFETPAYLNQSPQLYKQILMATGFDRVCEIGPAFRAEDHDTVRHLNEFTSIDMEMAFSDEEGAMGVLERLVQKSIKVLVEQNQTELEILGVKLEVPELPLKRVKYDEALKVVADGGLELPWGEDLPMEGMHILAKTYPSFHFITHWPTESKPFYAQPFEDEPKLCRAFDLNYGAKEITSGAQRVHNPQLLYSNLERMNLDPKAFEFYIKAFEYGMPPHAGWGLGLERFIMILTDLPNIRECVLFPRDRKRLVP